LRAACWYSLPRSGFWTSSWTLFWWRRTLSDWSCSIWRVS
jgi:hypothetical protein